MGVFVCVLVCECVHVHKSKCERACAAFLQQRFSVSNILSNFLKDLKIIGHATAATAIRATGYEIFSNWMSKMIQYCSTILFFNLSAFEASWCFSTLIFLVWPRWTAKCFWLCYFSLIF